MHFEQRDIETSDSIRRVLVVSADVDTVFGTDELAELRANADLTTFNELADHIGRNASPDAVCIRGRGADGSGQFRMAPSLEDDELDELGYRLLRALMPALRKMVRAGVSLVAVVELRVREQAALRAGAARLLARMRQAATVSDPAERKAAAETQRVLEHHVLWSGVGLETALEQVIPSRLIELGPPKKRRAGSGLHPA